MKSLSYIDNICVHGDSFYNYIVALIIPNPNAIRPLAKKLGLNEHASLPSLYANPQIQTEVLAALKVHAIKAGLHKSEIPQKIKLCHEEWTPDSGLVTAALKIRRKQIREFYQQDIERMYREESGNSVCKTKEQDLNNNNNNNNNLNGKAHISGHSNGFGHVDQVIQNEYADEKSI